MSSDMEARGPAMVLHGCDALQALLGRGQAGGGNTSCKPQRRPRQALAYCNVTAALKDATSSILPQGVQYFRRTGTHFSDTSAITYAVSKHLQRTAETFLYWEGDGGKDTTPKRTQKHTTPKRTEKPNRAIVVSYTCLPPHSPGQRSTAAQHKTRTTSIRALIRQLHFASLCGEWVPKIPNEFHGGGVKTQCYINCRLIHMIMSLNYEPEIVLAILRHLNHSNDRLTCN